MSCKPKTGISLFVLVISCYFYAFQLCCTVSLGRRKDDSFTSGADESDSSGWTEQNHRQQALSHTVKRVTWSSKSSLSSLLEPWEEPSSAGHPDPHVSQPEPDQTGVSVVFNRSTWTTGEVGTEGGPSAPAPEDGYQADFAGFSHVQGKVLGLLSHSSPHLSDWEAMRPLVECNEDVMTLTASGQGFTDLLVDRTSASPISIFQLPSSCGYSVKASWRDLKMMVPYDGCYILQENGSYVLPMLWLGSPLKLSCPMKMSTASPLYSLAAPLVFCSSYGMAVQIDGQEHALPVLHVLVNGAKGPFISEMCAYQGDSQLLELTFLISHNAPCLVADDGLQLHLILDDQQYLLSCPAIPQFPNAPSPPQSPGHPQSPYIPYPVRPNPTPPVPSQRLTQKQINPHENHHHYHYAGSQEQELPQVYRPTPPFYPPQPSDSSSWFQHQQVHSGSGKLSYSFGRHLQYPVPRFQGRDHSPYHSFKLPDRPSQHPNVYPYLSSYYVASTQRAEENLKHPAGSYDLKYYQTPYHPKTTAAPVPQAPALVLPNASPPKHPKGQYHQTNLMYSPVSFPALYPTAAPPLSPSGTDISNYPPRQLHLQSPSYFVLPTHGPPAREEPQKPAASQEYYSYPYPPYYHTPYPSLPHYPKVQTPLRKTPYTTSTISDWFTSQTPYLKCLKERMIVFLPFADPESLQVRDQLNAWQFLSSVSPQCGYMLQRTAGHGLILQSPLPACHSRLQTPTTVSLPIRYWDFSVWQNRSLDLPCPYQSTPETPAPGAPSKHPTPSSPTISPTVVTRTEVFCSFQQMKVVLPPGPTSEIVLKDINGNLINLYKAPKDCGYYAGESKDGKIHLILQLNSHCHMSVQNERYVINVIYMTESGRKEAQFSCPVVVPRSEHECNLHSEYHLPCGSSSISQTQCLSMGCCFNKHPPACYYPMDECTTDRHMVFSVPASLTDPPLSPALLVAANNSTCKPQKATAEYALFNIPMDGCGTRRVVLGKTVVYMVEITNVVQTVSLNYGTITRDSPVRLLVECRYMPGTVLSVGYVVKTPSFGPEVHTQGVFGVQLRIAKDAQYRSYYPQYHQPLHMLLGKPLHLEVQLLNSPDPSLVLLVHFCVAYPRSGKAVWVLLYNGCPNALDPAPPQTVLTDHKPSSSQSQTRRFTIRTFQFLPEGEFQDINEEIYFMCSTEICSPHDGPCVEGCFGH